MPVAAPTASSSSLPPAKRARLSPPQWQQPPIWPDAPVHITPTLAVPCARMRASSASLPASALLGSLSEDGCLLFRGLLPRDRVRTAREAIAADLAAHGFTVLEGDPGKLPILPSEASSCPDDGPDPDAGPNLLSRQDLARHDSVLRVLEHPSLYSVMAKLLDQTNDPPAEERSRRPHLSDDGDDDAVGEARARVKTHPYKWLRAVSTSLHTGPHRDATYFPTSSYPTLLTAWIPLGDLTPELGSLVVARKPAASAAAAEAEIKLGKDGTRSGWITDEEKLSGMEWVTESVRMGDVVVLGRERVHCSSVNVTGEWRLSCDTRWMRREVGTPPREELDSSDAEEDAQSSGGGSEDSAEDDESEEREEEEAAIERGS